MKLTNRQAAVGEAHCKLILVGEHIVVYNKPAIAIPFPLKIRALIRENPGEITISSKIYNGSLNGMPENTKGLLECIKGAFEYCNKPLEGVHIDIVSDIPIGRGFGSSAASATAVVRGIFRYFQNDLKTEELFSLVGLAETYAHGNPSGIDMMAVASDEPILFHRQTGASPLIASKPFHIVAADTGKVGDTKKAVTHVKDIKLKKPYDIDGVIEEIEEIVQKAKNAVITGDSELLGSLLSFNHEKLKELQVSDPLLDHLVEIALSSGALGAKLTGGGMGGCIIALAKDKWSAEVISEKLISQGAQMVWYFSTDSEELYVKDEVCNEGVML